MCPIWLCVKFKNGRMKKGILLFFILYTCLPTMTAQGSRRGDSLALVALYNATGGPNWTNKTNWLSAQPLETWFGLQIFQNRVTYIELDRYGVSSNQGNNLVGKIPSAVGDMTELSTLNLAYNQLSGTIPVEICRLSRLGYLALQKNQLSGLLPDSLNNLKSLGIFLLYGNKLSGNIPTNLCQLPNLINIRLDQNLLTGTIPDSIGFLRTLDNLSLDFNQLTGSIPPSVGQLTRATTLTLSNNKLTGSIPDVLGDMANLDFLDLQNNALTGRVPTSLNRLTKVRHIYLANNQLTGEFPALPFSLRGNMQISLGFNRFTFQHLLPNVVPSAQQNYFYAPQAPILTDTIVIKGKGQDLVFDLKIDSLVTSNIYKWYKNNSIFIDSFTQNKFILRGLAPKDSGAYFVKITNPNLPFLRLTGERLILKIDTTLSYRNQQLTLCNGASYTLPSGKIVRVSGVYYDTLRNQRGLDSFVTIVNLTVLPALSTNLERIVCMGDSFRLPNGTKVLCSSGSCNYSFSYLSVNGCDSSVNIHLMGVSATKAVDDVVEILEKDSLVTFDVAANDFMNATSRKQVTILQRPLHGVLKEGNTTGKMSFQSTSILRGSSQTFTYRLCNVDCPTLCDSARVTVHIKGFPPNIKPSKGITANADGINDKLEFEELDDPYKTHPNNELIVYNRWNDIVFTAKPYKNDWDGTNRNGEPLPAGTYYYILRLNIADGDVLTGDVTIIR